VLELNVVVRLVEPNETVAPLTKSVPEMVRVNAPTLICEGTTLVICGIGFRSVTSLVPARDGLEVSAAEMVTEFGVGKTAGAK
jgi:hypothetical protein